MKSLRLLICCLIALAGCKEEEQVPDHILQRRSQERRQRELMQQQKQEAKRRAKVEGKKRAGPKMWTAEVRRAALQIYKARGLQAARSIQTLAHLGPSSAAALRHIAGSQAMDQRKQVLASMVLVELQMFQPARLAELCRAHELPFVQQAAIEALGRLGNPVAERLLRELTPELSKQPLPPRKGQAHAPSNRPLRPLAQVLHKAKDRSRKWWYSDKQLVALDRVLQADTPDKLMVALMAVTDRTLDKGLRAILAAAAARPSVKAGVAHRIVALDKDRPRVLRGYCARREPQLLRLAAASRLLDLGQRAYVEKLSRAVGDPLTQVLGQMLKAPPRPPPGAPTGKPQPQ